MSIMTAARSKKEVDTSTYRGRFAVRLTELRKKAKLSVQELADKSGIPASTLYDWEAARKPNMLDRFPELADALGVKPSKLLPD